LPGEDRPTGVAILAILEAIDGIYYLIIGGGQSLAAAILLIPRVLGTTLIIVGLASLLLAWGLWTGKGWARMVALVIAILGIILSLIPPFHFVGLVIDAIIIYYLTRPNVKKYFTKN